MKIIDKDTLSTLSKFETTFRYAIKSNFVSIKTSEFGEFITLYNQFFPPLKQSQMSCNTCRLNAMKKLGELYFENKEYYVEKEKEMEVEEEPTTPPTAVEEEPLIQPKKRGRPKKMDVEVK